MVNPSSTKKLASTSQPAISRLALHDEVTLRLRDMIVEGQLEAGARIQEMELAQVLGVSRTPIREAIKVLASEGLVDMLPLKGAVVKQFSDKDAQDMLKVIAVLESFAAKQAKAASQAEIDHILALHQNTRRIVYCWTTNRASHREKVKRGDSVQERGERDLIYGI